MLYIAHRGACIHHPENSLAAIKLALKQDFDGVEFDVRASKDGKLYLMHDERLLRTTDGWGKLGKKASHHIKHISLANNEKIPTLEEALELVRKGPKKLLVLELKEPGYEDAILYLIKKHGLHERTVISSWRRDVLINIRKLDKNIRMEYETIMPSIADIKFAKKTKCWSICFERIFASSRMINELRMNRIKAFVTYWIFDYGIMSARKLHIDGMFVRSI